MADSTPIDPQINTTALVTDSGSLSFDHTMGGQIFTLSHPSGSNTQYSNGVTSTFNSGKAQSLTLGNSFNTVKGDSNSFTQGSKDNRVEGDYVSIVGGSQFLSADNPADAYVKDYCKTLGIFKQQWPDNRESLPPEAYPPNTVFSKPPGAATIPICIDIPPGTLADNLDPEAKQAFEDKMMDSIREATGKVAEATDAIYNDPTNNGNEVMASILGLNTPADTTQ